MAKAAAYHDGSGWLVLCPACKTGHKFVAQRWDFNGDLQRPTFTPSMLVQSGHYVNGFIPGDACWCSYYAERPGETAEFKCVRCHSFVRDGKIEFLADCSHEMAGQTVELPDIHGT